MRCEENFKQLNSSVARTWEAANALPSVFGGTDMGAQKAAFERVAQQYETTNELLGLIFDNFAFPHQVARHGS